MGHPLTSLTWLLNWLRERDRASGRASSSVPVPAPVTCSPCRATRSWPTSESWAGSRRSCHHFRDARCRARAPCPGRPLSAPPPVGRIAIVRGAGPSGMCLRSGPGPCRPSGHRSIVTAPGRRRSARTRPDRGRRPADVSVPVSAPRRPGPGSRDRRGEGTAVADAVLFTTKGRTFRRPSRRCSRDGRAGTRAGRLWLGCRTGSSRTTSWPRRSGRRLSGRGDGLRQPSQRAGRASVTGLGTTFFGDFGSPTSARAERAGRSLVGAGLPCQAWRTSGRCCGPSSAMPSGFSGSRR